jgi:hypothetical protein
MVYTLVFAISGTIESGSESCETNGGIYDTDTSTCIFSDRVIMYVELGILTGTIVVLENGAQLNYEFDGLPPTAYVPSLFSNFGQVTNLEHFDVNGSEIRNFGTLLNNHNLTIQSSDHYCYSPGWGGGEVTFCMWSAGELNNFGYLQSSASLELIGSYFDNKSQFTNTGIFSSLEKCDVRECTIGYFYNRGYFTNTGYYNQDAHFRSGQTLNTGMIRNLRTMDVISGALQNEGTLENHGRLTVYDTLSNTGTISNSAEFINKGTVVNANVLHNDGMLKNRGFILGDVFNTGLIWNFGTISGTVDGPGTIINFTHHMQFPVIINHRP